MYKRKLSIQRQNIIFNNILVEIAKSHNVEYKPNPEISVRDPNYFYDLIENNNRPGGSSGGAPGSGGGGSVSNMTSLE